MNSRCFKWMRSSLVDFWALLWIFPKLCNQEMNTEKSAFFSYVTYPIQFQNENYMRANETHTHTYTLAHTRTYLLAYLLTYLPACCISQQKWQTVIATATTIVIAITITNRKIPRHFIMTIKYVGGFVLTVMKSCEK